MEIHFSKPSTLPEVREAPSRFVAVNLLLFTAGLGLISSWLFRGQELGLNLLVGMGLLYAGGRLFWGPAPAGVFQKWWFGVALFGFTGCVAWRDSGTLNWLAGGVVLLLLVLAAAREGRGAWRITILRAARHGWETVAHLLGGFLQLAGKETQWAGLPQRSLLRQAGSGLLGLVIALPLVFVFAALFSSADAVYKERLGQWLDFNWGGLWSFVLWAGAIWWLTAGYLRKLLTAGNAVPVPPVLDDAGRARLGAIEVNVVLGVLNLLFLSFVLVQVKYLFGGEHLVQVTPGLSFADYARRGFFELVAVAGLVLPLLLLADWVYPRNSPRLPLRILCATLIALLAVVMISAARRMQLYQAEYGLTELRFYVSAFMIFLAGVFGWFGCTVLRGRREYFLSGAVVLGMAGVVALHLANPDAWIARVNLERAAEGKLFDPVYAAGLSADAVPVLREGMELVPEEGRTVLRARLEKRWGEAEQTWRGWNWGKGRVRLRIRN